MYFYLIYIFLLWIGKIKISYKYIDESDPERQFYILIGVNEQMKYEVNNTVPTLSTISILVDKLNQNNNFSLFVQNVRRAFIELVNQA